MFVLQSDAAELLRIENLRVDYATSGGNVRALDCVSLGMQPKEFTAVVGESGSGKSTLALSVIRLLPPNASLEGTILYKGTDVVCLDDDDMTRLRGTQVSMIFQEPLSSLIPVRKIGDQMSEAIKVRQGREAVKTGFRGRVLDGTPRDEALAWLDAVKIPDPERVAEMYSFELSGGMVQRVMIALALSLRPSLLLADEPTTALDVTTQAGVLKLVRDLADETGVAVLLVTHDLGVAAQVADKVVVMYAGTVVEEANTEELFSNPLHPYTQKLMRCFPRGNKGKEKLETIKGSVPDLSKEIKGCKFSERCAFVTERCFGSNPEYTEVNKGHFVRCTQYY